MSPKRQTHKVNRSSITGHFVTEKYANQHPKTTQSETVPNPPKKKPSSKKK
jgi:hypothetical protein